MVDYALSTLEQYDLEIKNVRKGRGSWVVSCKEGDFVLKEYSGSEEKAALQKALTHQITEQTGVLAQEIVPNREGSLLVKDAEERTYTLQTYMEGRECNLKEEKECESAIITMARMHQGMCLTLDTLQYPVPYSLKREFAKRNAELRRIRRYLKEKKNKNEFESVGIGGVINFIVPMLNDFYSGWAPKLNWLQICLDKISKNIDVYMILLKRFKINCKNYSGYTKKCLLKSENSKYGTWDIKKNKTIFEKIESL